MKKLLIAIWTLILLLLSTNTIWFMYLDKKLDKAIEKQEEINRRIYQTVSNQEKSIRIMETNNELMFNIIVNGDFYEKD